MLEFIRSVYRVFVLIGFWVFLVGCTIGGGVLANMTYSSGSSGWYGRSSSSGIHPFWGGFIGLIVGFVIDVLVFGFIATILNIDENIEEIYENTEEQNRLLSEIVKKNSSQSQVSASNSGNRSIVSNKLQKKCRSCHKEVDEDYSSCPHCGNKTFE